VPPTTQAAAACAAVAAAADLGVRCTEPVVLADGANVVVYLSPSPVVAKVAVSTAVLRPQVADWLQRELELALFLASEGAPVIPPSPEVPATTHRAAGYVMSFWRYLRSSGDVPDEATIGSMLRDLHHVLRSYQPAPPFLAPLRDIPAFLARSHTQLTTRDTDALTAAFARLTAELDAASSPSQVLHGDAGALNLMATGSGWVWHDFEDTCRGPVAWDLAASTASPRLERARILAAYQDPVDPDQLDICQQLRRLHLTVWYALYAERLPELRGRAAELLATWQPA
jgi:Ser/Thr protein kinase RdoA (MazF antagonist)